MSKQLQKVGKAAFLQAINKRVGYLYGFLIYVGKIVLLLCCVYVGIECCYCVFKTYIYISCI